ncbi:hypothetical protein [Paraburkholderia diazotrophica]|uniref:hypothetical protein n=1 Tax=Paraburkholderia diazotrophica TaxID=667676 RepID=UPI003179ABC0
MSDLLYQVTQASARVCAPLYAASSVATSTTSGLVSWLDRWQTLVGSFVGGLMGVSLKHSEARCSLHASFRTCEISFRAAISTLRRVHQFFSLMEKEGEVQP